MNENLRFPEPLETPTPCDHCRKRVRTRYYVELAISRHIDHPKAGGLVSRQLCFECASRVADHNIGPWNGPYRKARGVDVGARVGGER